MSGAGTPANSAPVSSSGGSTPQSQGGTLRATPGGTPEDISRGAAHVAQPGDMPVPGAAPATPGATPTETPPVDQNAPPAPAAVTPDPNSFEVRAEKFTKEFTDTGNLAPASITEAAKTFGVTEDVVRQYMRGAMAGQDQVAQAVKLAHDTVGGETQWQDFAAWANGNLSGEELMALADGVNRGVQTPAQSKAIIDGFYARFKSAGGVQPRDVTREGGASSQVAAEGGFKSQAEMVTAMQDKRYNRDPDYTAEVVAKVAASKFR